MTVLTTNTGSANAEATRFLPLVAFLVASVFVVLPILAHPYLPLIDLPNHIARHHIATLSGGPLEPYYSYQIALVPNSAVDLMWRLLGFPGDPVKFSQYVMVFYGLSLIASTMVLSRVAIGRWSVWPVAIAMFVFNSCFYWGFQNYVVSIPFAIIGLALWIWSERLPPAARLLLLMPYTGVLYLMHFFAFSALAIAAFGRECQLLRESGHDWPIQLRRGALLSIPFVLPIAWLVFGIVTGEPSPAGSLTMHGGLASPIQAVLSVTLLAAFNSNGAEFIVGVVILFGLAVFALALCRRAVKTVTFAPVLIGPVLALLVAALSAPHWLNGVALTNIRLPVIVVAVLFAGTRWQGLSARSTAFLAIILAVVMLAQSSVLDRRAGEYSHDIEDMIAAIEPLPAGSRLLPVRAPGMEWENTLWHSQAYAIITRDAFIPTLFQGVHAVQVLPKWKDYTHPALFPPDIRRLKGNTELGRYNAVFIRDWQQKFTHVLLMDADTSYAELMPELVEISRKGRFTLYEVAHTDGG